MSSPCFVISFGDGTCPDCYRPHNAGGVHNPGCRIHMRRWCPLCESTHDAGDDCHSDIYGFRCSTDFAIRRGCERNPGWDRDRVVGLVEARVRLVCEARDAVQRMQSDPVFVRAVMASQIAKGG